MKSTQLLLERLSLAALLFLLALLVATGGYLALAGSGVSVLQSLYMAYITLLGVGYAEIVDTAGNAPLRVFNMLVLMGGLALRVYLFAAAAAFMVTCDLGGRPAPPRSILGRTGERDARRRLPSLVADRLRNGGMLS